MRRIGQLLSAAFDAFERALDAASRVLSKLAVVLSKLVIVVALLFALERALREGELPSAELLQVVKAALGGGG